MLSYFAQNIPVVMLIEKRMMTKDGMKNPTLFGHARIMSIQFSAMKLKTISIVIKLLG